MEDGAPQPASSPEIAEQARVATVLYDMLLRGVALDDDTLLHLSTAYPASAALAHQCALRSRHALHFADTPDAPDASLHSYAPSPLQQQVKVVSRIDILSFARWSGWLGFILAFSRLVFAALMAFTTTVARTAHPEIASQVVQIAEALVGTGRGLRLYRTLLAFVELQLAEGNGHTAMTSATDISINAAVYLALWFPVGAGIIAALTGAVTAFCLNGALILSGGLRYQQHVE